MGLGTWLLIEREAKVDLMETLCVSLMEAFNKVTSSIAATHMSIILQRIIYTLFFFQSAVQVHEFYVS